MRGGRSLLARIDVQACYSEFLGAPLSPLAEELLHTDHHAWTMPNEGTC
ncbi:MAG: iron hydrogenase small subunit [Collinsella sp.]